MAQKYVTVVLSSRKSTLFEIREVTETLVAEEQGLIDIIIVSPTRYRFLYQGNFLLETLESDNWITHDYQHTDLKEKITTSGDLQIEGRTIIRSPPHGLTFEDAKERFVIMKDGLGRRALFRQQNENLFRYSAVEHSVTNYHPFKNTHKAIYIHDGIPFYTNGYAVYSLRTPTIFNVKQAVLLSEELKALFPDANFTRMPWRTLLESDKTEMMVPESFSANALYLLTDGRIYKTDTFGRVNILAENIQTLLSESFAITTGGKLLFLGNPITEIATVGDAVLTSVFEKHTEVAGRRKKDPKEHTYERYVTFLTNPRPFTSTPKRRYLIVGFSSLIPHVFIPELSTYQTLINYRNLGKKVEIAGKLRRKRFHHDFSALTLSKPLRSSIPIRPDSSLEEIITAAIYTKKDISHVLDISLNEELRHVVLEVDTQPIIDTTPVAYEDKDDEDYEED